MEQKQPKQTMSVEVKQTERLEQPQRRLRLDTLESRLAPNALWGD